ncbi:hypothetical protein Anas_03070 [Armadillidium nasatum]|uniref:Uncharacterized protein n=1 Tax=Armadillidium nasatum TaxID=96803 RepID=A0A5N5TLA3_9CRUS|nr:hypothetical protein Anas_03070 [Armadillidium nasatum]
MNKSFEDGNEENFTRQRIYHSRDVNNICGIPPFRTLPPVTAKGNLTPNKNCASLSDQVWKSSLGKECCWQWLLYQSASNSYSVIIMDKDTKIGKIGFIERFLKDTKHLKRHPYKNMLENVNLPKRKVLVESPSLLKHLYFENTITLELICLVMRFVIAPLPVKSVD